MHTGLCLTFQNLGQKLSDGAVYEHELHLADLAESAGFDSVWTPEHHFTDYMLTPNVPQFLSWLAGRTTTLRLGTMVTVLPWHDPVRVAESFSLLDHLSHGRAMLGIGRGLGRVEFEGLRIAMGESRERFNEYAQAILNALDDGYMEFDGKYLKQPRVDIRPRPLRSFRGRTFASAISSESMELMASMGLGLMIIAQKPWERTEADLQAYRTTFRERNGREAIKPLINIFVGVSQDPAQAQSMRDVYLQEYARSTVDHYEFGNVEFANIDGYEYYGRLAAQIQKQGIGKFNGFLADLQVWGTPSQVVQKITEYVKRCDAGGLLIALGYGGMSPAEANANFELFTSEVLPALKTLDVGGDLGVAHEPCKVDSV